MEDLCRFGCSRRTFAKSLLIFCNSSELYHSWSGCLRFENATTLITDLKWTFRFASIVLRSRELFWLDELYRSLFDEKVFVSLGMLSGCCVGFFVFYETHSALMWRGSILFLLLHNLLILYDRLVVRLECRLGIKKTTPSAIFLTVIVLTGRGRWFNVVRTE